MAVWLLNHYDFVGKTVEEVAAYLYEDPCELTKNGMEDSVISIPLRNWSEKFLFFRYRDERGLTVDAYMNLYLKEGAVEKVEIEEWKDPVWVVVKSTEE